MYASELNLQLKSFKQYVLEEGGSFKQYVLEGEEGRCLWKKTSLAMSAVSHCVEPRKKE